MHSVNGAQFLNVTPLLVSSARFVASLSPNQSIVVVPFKSIYALL